jgi:hypothetical protein
MPAHTSEADVGSAVLSNGELLTSRDRAANDAADVLAKRGAETHRVPKAARTSIKKHELLAIWAARSLACTTHAANNVITPGVEGVSRDSAGLPRWKRTKKTLASSTNSHPDCELAVEEKGLQEQENEPASSVATPPVATPPQQDDNAMQECDDQDEKFIEPGTTVSSRQCKRRRVREDHDRLDRNTAWRRLQVTPDCNTAFARFRLRDVREQVLAKTRNDGQTMTKAVPRQGCQCPPAGPLLDELDRIESGLVGDVDSAVDNILAQLAMSCSWCVTQANGGAQPITTTGDCGANEPEQSTAERRCFERIADGCESIQRPTKAARTDKGLPRKLVDQSIASLLR